MCNKLIFSLAGVAFNLAASGLVFAADMAVKAPPPALAPVDSWTGWYVGGNIGYGWGNDTGEGFTSFTDPGELNSVASYFAVGGNVLPGVVPKGVVGGGQIGYDWQLSQSWVTGLVADFQASGMKDSASAIVSTPPFHPFTTIQSNTAQNDWLGTVRGRLGVASNSWLFYGTGGLAYGEVKSTVVFTGVNSNPANAVFAGTTTSTRTGWTVGGGLEYAFCPNWRVGVDYIFFDLGRISATAVPVSSSGPFLFPTPTFTAASKFAGSVARLVLNYKFN